MIELGEFIKVTESFLPTLVYRGGEELIFQGFSNEVCAYLSPKTKVRWIKVRNMSLIIYV